MPVLHTHSQVCLFVIIRGFSAIFVRFRAGDGPKADGNSQPEKAQYANTPIRTIDTKSVRSAGRSTSGVRLLNLDTDDKVASATVIPQKTPN